MSVGRMRCQGHVDVPAFTNVTYRLFKTKGRCEQTVGPEFKALVNCLVYANKAYSMEGMQIERLVRGEPVEVDDFVVHMEKRFSVD